MVKAYFTACEQAFPAQRAQLRRLALALGRGGVERMEQLCAMQRAGPEGLLEIRSIGAKSLPLIAAVCARYEANRTPSQGGYPLASDRFLSDAGMSSCQPTRRNLMKKRLLSLLCVLALCLGLLPATALADNGTLTYQYYDTESGQMTEGTYTGEYTTVATSTTTWNDGWYVVSGSVSSTRDTTITVSGTVNLILTSGKTLTLNGPNISLYDSSAVLNIYGQADNTGKLSITPGYNSGDAGIHLNGGTLNIHGGTVTATGYTNSATKSAPGIDLGTGTLTVYGGSVTANAGTSDGAGYGAGIRVTSGGTVNIHGGTVNATGASSLKMGGYSGAGIGGSGGGGASAGIGGGQGSRTGGAGGNVTITGGTVNATGGSSLDSEQAPGIGGGNSTSGTGGAGSFSTGTNGSAVITTTGGIQAGTSGCSAIIDNKVYGNVTLPDSQLSSKNLTVSENANLTIPDGAALSSSITVNENGTLTVSGTVTNSGAITNNGTLTGGGTINNTGNGKVTGEGTNNTVTITYPSTVTVTSNQSNDTVGPNQEVTFTATVTGNDTVGTPTGTVQFKDNGNDLGTAQTLNNEGKATYTTSNLEIGEHKITAVYSGDGSSYQGSTSSALTFTVVGEVASIEIKTQPTTMTYTTGQALDLTGLEITVSYAGSTYTQDITWSADSGITASIDDEPVTTLYASRHNGQAITITYKEQTATTNALTVSKATPTVTAPTASTLTYNGTPQSLVSEGTTSGGEMQYSTEENGNYSTAIPTGTDAGDYTVYYKVVGNDDYNDVAAQSVSVTIAKANAQVTAAPQAVEALAFTGQPHALVTAGSAAGGTMQYSLSEDGEYTEAIPTGTDAGDYTVWYKVVGDNNHNDTTAQSVSVTIGKAAATVTTAPQAVTGLTYTGNPQALVTAGTAEGGEMQYSTEENGTYSTDIPTGTEAKTYTVYYKVVGDSDHSDTQPVKLEVTIAGVSIAGAEVSIDPATATYNGSEQAPTVTVTLDDKELDGDTDYEVSYDPAEVKNAGTYTVTVTGTGNYEGTATATFTIQKADPNIGDVTYSGGDLYDSTALSDITLSREHETVSGTLELDAGQTLMAGTHDYKWTFTPDDAANYETITDTVQLTVQADTLESVSVKYGPDKTEYVYGDTFDKTGLVLEATYASNNKKEISAEEISVETTGPLTCDMTAVTVSYQGKTCTVTVTVGQATYSGQRTVTGTIWANTASEVQLPQPPDGATFGNPVYSVDSDTVVRVEITGNTLAYEGGSGVTKGQEYEITVPVNGGTNYENYTITVTLTGTDKKVPTGAPTLSTTTITYGQSLSTIALSGSMQDGAETVTGTFTWDAPTTTPDAGSYEAHWTFTPADGNLYVSVSGTTTITVNKATPTGTPKYTAITTSGKTLADAGLTTEGGTFSVPGTVAWEQADTTQVQANTAYTWKFTPTDSDNYNSISGSVTLYVVSSSGGGGGSSGGGSSSSGSQTETTTNPDGSTTTTVTSSNGTVTETTKNPDGSQKVVETKKDGTVTTTTTDTTGNKTQVVENTDGTKETTITNKDGSGSATTVDETGKTQAEVKLPAAVVEDAQGEAVTLPMPEVPITTDRETAPTVTVDLPSGTSAKVEIPVAEVTPGTVAVIVKADGTEEVIKTSLTTENGVAVTLSDGDTVKVVDNSKTFDDVADNYWGAEAVDFAVSRELFAGTSATTFAPDTAMTRAMIVTVLARFEGVDTTTGSTWYEAGQQWAMENGVSDGTNMDASLTREQLATMLWRYAGSPSVSDNLSGYTDADTVSSYAQQAMAWCVEHGIIGGTTTTTLSPQGPATRAQVATILMRFLEANQ